MKKIKIKATKNKMDLLTREELRLIMGGDGSDFTCQAYGSPCDTETSLNCCSGLVCVKVGSSEICKLATV
jgi:hypothetical protein